VDKMVKRLHDYLKWQSERGMPQTSFPSGITKLTKMQGNERTGVLLLILLILVTTKYWLDWRQKKLKLRKNPTAVEAGYLVSALSHERFNNMIKALGLMITFESFIPP
jgi:hypothetical protein